MGKRLSEVAVAATGATGSSIRAVHADAVARFREANREETLRYKEAS